MRVALIYPPTCDPTAPYLSVPMLTGFLRSHGVEVLPIDANVEAYDALLREAPLAAVRERIEHRLDRLDARASLSHVEQLAYVALQSARGDAHAAPGLIADAVATMRDRARFFDPGAYEHAVQAIEAALRAISAAHAPLELSFTAYRTPFALLSPDEIRDDARAERDPFASYEETLAARLAAADVHLVGLSVVFPGQLQPAFAFALRLRARLGPTVHLTVGGPALTQLVLGLRNDPTRLERLLGPFDSAVLYEGETALLRLCEAVDAGTVGQAIPNLLFRGGAVTPGGTLEDLRTLPAPDFDGLPLDCYFAPARVLPYDPTRGCYWGVCTFCHYGLAEKGTAPYKERAVETVIEHLEDLSARFHTPYFYFSQDSVAPKTLVKLADAIAARGLGVKWGTDLKPERYLTAERARRLREGGALACALGVESAAPRVLKLIDKGAPIEVVRDVIGHLSAAGVAVEAMCFTDFPTETYGEAMATVRFLDGLWDEVALFILGEFDLTPGSLVAERPSAFGLAETWRVEGDELGMGLFWREARPAKREAEAERLDAAIAALAGRWRLRRYPWAGSLSTAHTLLHYEAHGPAAFRRPAPRLRARVVDKVVRARFPIEEIAERARANELGIWHTLVYERRRVTRADYQALAKTMPAAQPAPRRYRFSLNGPPQPAATRGPATRGPSSAASRGEERPVHRAPSTTSAASRGEERPVDRSSADGRRPHHQPRGSSIRRPTW